MALLEAEGVGMVRRVYAEAAHEAIMKDFASSKGLKESTGHPCISRLIQGKCGSDGRRVRPLRNNISCRLPCGNDHVSMWLKNGQPHSYISQPYNLSLRELRELVDFCDTHGLTAEVTAGNSWHFPGASLLLEVKKTEETEARGKEARQTG